MIELVEKWSVTGLLRDVKPQYIQLAAQRLEAANHKRGQVSIMDAIDRELRSMDRDGLFQ